MLKPEEEQFIREIEDYSYRIRGYSRSRILQNNRSMTHIFNQLSVEVVISELTGNISQKTIEQRKHCIYRALRDEGEISDKSKVEREIKQTLSTVIDYYNWKREQSA